MTKAPPAEEPLPAPSTEEQRLKDKVAKDAEKAHRKALKKVEKSKKKDLARAAAAAQSAPSTSHHPHRGYADDHYDGTLDHAYLPPHPQYFTTVHHAVDQYGQTVLLNEPDVSQKKKKKKTKQPPATSGPTEEGGAEPVADATKSKKKKSKESKKSSDATFDNRMVPAETTFAENAPASAPTHRVISTHHHVFLPADAARGSFPEEEHGAAAPLPIGNTDENAVFQEVMDHAMMGEQPDPLHLTGGNFHLHPMEHNENNSSQPNQLAAPAKPAGRRRKATNEAANGRHKRRPIAKDILESMDAADQGNEIVIEPGRWYTNEEMKTLCARGFQFEEGRYQAHEDEILHTGVAAFMEEHGLDENGISEIVWRAARAKEVDNKELTNQFWSRIGLLLPRRHKRSLWHHLRTMYHPDRKSGGKPGYWSKQDDEQLLQSHEIYGKEWARVSVRVGRTPQACKDRIRHLDRIKNNPAPNVKRKTATQSTLRNARRRAHLSDADMHQQEHLHAAQEDEMPMGAVVSGYDGEALYWTALDDYRLVTRLREYTQHNECQDENSVAWDELCDLYWGGRFAPEELRKRWLALVKAKCDRQTFDDGFEGLVAHIKDKTPVIKMSSADVTESEDEDVHGMAYEDEMHHDEHEYLHNEELMDGHHPMGHHDHHEMDHSMYVPQYSAGQPQQLAAGPH